MGQKLYVSQEQVNDHLLDFLLELFLSIVLKIFNVFAVSKYMGVPPFFTVMFLAYYELLYKMVPQANFYEILGNK